jgi:hypothetical protein
MALKIISLGDSEPERKAAMLLRGLAHLRVRSASKGAEELRDAGFVELPASVECLIPIPLDPLRLSRRMRHLVTRAVEAWQQKGLSLCIETSESFGVERLVQEVYYPLLVRHFYARGVSPFGAHNEDQFRRLVTQGVLLALARDGSTMVGAALLAERRSEHIQLTLRGPAPTGPGLEGLMYALDQSLDVCRRAFIPILASAFSSLGYQILSLGRDLPWMEPDYCDVFFEKTRIAKSIIANRAEPCDLYHFSGSLFSNGYGLVWWEISGNECRLAHAGPVGDKAARLATMINRKESDE